VRMLVLLEHVVDMVVLVMMHMVVVMSMVGHMSVVLCVRVVLLVSVSVLVSLLVPVRVVVDLLVVVADRPALEPPAAGRVPAEPCAPSAHLPARPARSALWPPAIRSSAAATTTNTTTRGETRILCNREKANNAKLCQTFTDRKSVLTLNLEIALGRTACLGTVTGAVTIIIVGSVAYILQCSAVQCNAV
jgi:hypothetical protein